MSSLSVVVSSEVWCKTFVYVFFLIAVAIWPVTGQGVENTKWPEVLYSQQISQNRKILANHNYHMSI